ncbi:MAG: guanosine monophosphate reductase [Erysipelotrichales bacterium]|nr:MAG: guanosine monophosphate reductase [Erysipelotrichales bacterium]
MKQYNQFDIAEHDLGLTFDDINIIPAYSEIVSRKDISTRTRLVGDIYLDNPIIPANMDTITDVDMMVTAARNGSIAFLHRFMDVNDTLRKLQQFCDTSNMPYGQAPIGVSVGIGDNEIYRARKAIEFFMARQILGPSHLSERMVILIDVAHAHNKRTIAACKEICALIRVAGLEDKIFVIVGNIATGTAARALLEAGARGLKVGIGNGSLCETRIRTGAGVPQISALADIYIMLHNFSGSSKESLPTIMADGGVKYPGDVVKALWLFADTVMSGYMFAGTNETPGETMKKGLFPNEYEIKMYRGSASHASKVDRGESSNIEGNVKEIPSRGPVQYVFDQIRDGIQSGFSYVGARDVNEFRGKATVTVITSNGVVEARPNLLER